MVPSGEDQMIEWYKLWIRPPTHTPKYNPFPLRDECKETRWIRTSADAQETPIEGYGRWFCIIFSSFSSQTSMHIPLQLGVWNPHCLIHLINDRYRQTTTTVSSMKLQWATLASLFRSNVYGHLSHKLVQRLPLPPELNSWRLLFSTNVRCSARLRYLC